MKKGIFLTSPALVENSDCPYNAIAEILDNIKNELKLEDAIYYAHDIPYYNSYHVHLRSDSIESKRIDIILKNNTFTIYGLPKYLNLKKVKRKLNQQK